METEITIIFHNQGLRSYIEADLCGNCPRQDDKGCCGYYSPVFYPTDMAYLLMNHPQILDDILQMERLTILDASVTVNNIIEAPGYRCRFHSRDRGCVLSQSMRESVCRHFVCAGIGWWEDADLAGWKLFFELLTEYEIELNNLWATRLKEQGLSLRDPGQHPRIFAAIQGWYQEALQCQPEFMDAVPARESRTLRRSLRYATEWNL